MGIWRKIFGKVNQNKKQPEDLYEVEITDNLVRVIHPSRPVEQIEWAEIEEIKIVNTDEGPFLPDVWLVLIGNGKGCSIPQNSEGWNKVYDVVSNYDGFNFENVMASAFCTENKTFDLWKR